MPQHKPVLLEESLRLLNLKAGEVAVDATLGQGGHASKIAELVGPSGRLIGVDQDPASIEANRVWSQGLKQATLVRANFADDEKLFKTLNLSKVDAVLVDTGYSSDQMEDPSRGLSFNVDGPLDMRLNPDLTVRACDLIQDLSQSELERLFRTYGEERFSGRFARVVCEARDEGPIETTGDLIHVLARALPAHFSAPRGHRSKFMRRHFATRIFQALRIAVNHELENLESGLKNFWNRLNYSGRIAVISFHSLEDRIVKNFFREKAACGEGELLCKKPLTPSDEEIKWNPRSRSAKLRGIRKLL